VNTHAFADSGYPSSKSQDAVVASILFDINSSALPSKPVMSQPAAAIPFPPFPPKSHRDRASAIHAERVDHAAKEWYDLDSRRHAASLSATQQPKFAKTLEVTCARDAKLMPADQTFIARDSNDRAILAYFPKILEPTTIHATYRALDEYVTATPFNEQTDSEPPKGSKQDQGHPYSARLSQLHGNRLGLRHCGMWPATGDPNELPFVSSDVIHTPTLLRAAATLFQHLRLLTVELSILFCAFDCRAWSIARQFIAALNHFHPDFSTCRVGRFECWAHRALLFNLDTHAHRNLRDDRDGYAAIAVFGSFTGGEFVIPQLGIKFPFQPGDVIFIKGQMLQHFVTEWTGKEGKGERFCITHFTHQALLDSVDREVSDHARRAQ
jgi:hypothetical protein